MIEVKTISKALRAMADRLDKNADSPFGGLFVIAPPGDGTIQEALIFDSTQSSPAFWGLINGKAQQALVELEAAERLKRGFQGR